MHNILIDNWNKKVSDKDDVYIVGDFSNEKGYIKTSNILKYSFNQGGSLSSRFRVVTTWISPKIYLASIKLGICILIIKSYYQ
ncbi:hypothetical protein OGZ02_05955 [Brachyspira hyodysenteriae]|nr:hypothetical protein [Brachyspira hyodysenteriae]MDA1468394.1 hypothetical protein [Brachyspira hyodysenteriae]